MKKKLILAAAKLGAYGLGGIITEKLEKLYGRMGIFSLGLAIETFYLERKGDFIGITSVEKLNVHIQNMVFSLLFQIAGDSIIYDDYEIIFDDILNVIIAYSATLPVLAIE